MHQYKPVDREIRRSFQAGFWLQYKLSAHEQHLHFKINHMQIDNQLPNVVFPIAFSPAPLPQSVLSDHGEKTVMFHNIYPDFLCKFLPLQQQTFLGFFI